MILDEGVGCPTIDAKIKSRTATAIEYARVVDDAAGGMRSLAYKTPFPRTTDRDVAPGSQPFPPMKLPLVCHFNVNWLIASE